jgi:hypothetical protein
LPLFAEQPVRFARSVVSMGDCPRSFAVLVITAALVGATGHARAAGTIHLDAAKLRAPLVSPPIEVALQGTPTALGLSCDGVADASTTHEPVLAWALSTPEPSLRVTITGAGGALGGPEGVWHCADAHGEIVLDHAPAGTYHLYAFAKASTATVTVRVESPSRLRAAAEQMLARAPVIVIGASTRPNPEMRAVPGVAGAQARDLGFCRGERESFMPVARLAVSDDLARLHVSERVRRTVGGHAAALQLVDGNGRCVEGGAVKAGAYALWAEIERDHPPRSVSLEVDDASRPLVWADAPGLDLSTVAEPLVIDGKIERAAPRPSRDTSRCKPLVGAPSFYLIAHAPHPGVELLMVWARRAQWYLIEGPGLSRCSDDGAPTTFDAVEGRYAVWAGGTVGTDFMFLVHRADQEVNPLATFVHPPADLVLADRVLSHFYPFFTIGDDEVQAAAAADGLFAAAPDGLLVYARGDGAPMLLLAIDHALAELVTVDGRTVHLPVAALTTTRPAQVNLPAAASTRIRERFAR